MGRAADRAVDWFEANRVDDGRYLYRYDRDRAVVEPGYNDVRHAGVMLALYQAADAGIEGALAAADHGRAYVDANLVETAVGPAFGRGAELPSGATALLVSALDERSVATGSTGDDELLRRLGRTLAATVGPGGEVAARIAVDDGPVVGTTSRYFTGEVAWALARLHLRFPDEGFDTAARQIRRYVVEERDEREGTFPPRPDHWMGYTYGAMAAWPASTSSTSATGEAADADADARWAARQIAMFGLAVRYESQRWGGITSLTRGPRASGAGLGTLGEGLGGHLTAGGELVGSPRGVALDRLHCVAGLLASRQAGGDDPRVAGAWFTGGDTQMDDQQHALSALLAARRLLSAAPAGGHEEGSGQDPEGSEDSP